MVVLLERPRSENTPTPPLANPAHAQMTRPIPQMTRPSRNVRVHNAHIWSINTADCFLPSTTVCAVWSIYFVAHDVFKHAVEKPQCSSFHLTSCIEFSNSDFRIFSGDKTWCYSEARILGPQALIQARCWLPQNCSHFTQNAHVCSPAAHECMFIWNGAWFHLQLEICLKYSV